MEIAQNIHIRFESDSDDDDHFKSNEDGPPELEAAAEPVIVGGSSSDDTIIYDVDRAIQEAGQAAKRRRSRKARPDTWKKTKR